MKRRRCRFCYYAPWQFRFRMGLWAVRSLDAISLIDIPQFHLRLIVDFFTRYIWFVLQIYRQFVFREIQQWRDNFWLTSYRFFSQTRIAIDFTPRLSQKWSSQAFHHRLGLYKCWIFTGRIRKALHDPSLRIQPGLSLRCMHWTFASDESLRHMSEGSYACILKFSWFLRRRLSQTQGSTHEARSITITHSSLYELLVLLKLPPVQKLHSS
jgi:hypothetical protein